MTEEIWKPIPGCDGDYQASSLGRIRVIRVLKTSLNVNGRYAVRVKSGGRTRTRPVATLVCEAFHGPRPPGHDVDHRDYDATHDAPGNLRWRPSKENQSDRPNRPRGSAHNFSRGVTSKVVADIRSHPYRRGLFRDLARKHGQDARNISAIYRNRTWTHVPLNQHAVPEDARTVR